jgi:predicted amidohydrolase
MFRGAEASSDPVGANLERACALIDHAAEEEADLIILPEAFNLTGLPGEEWVERAETLDGPTVSALAERARRHGAYVVCPMFQRVDDTVFNSAILLDRSGVPMGSYHKMYPTVMELDLGVRPGEEAWVAETDFGKVGFAICFDLNFRAVGEANARQGAELIAFPSMYRGGLSARIWAYDFGCFLASATPSEMSHFCDPLGRVIADQWAYQPVVTRRINFDFHILHIDTNERRWADIRAKYGARVELDILGPEGVFMLSSVDPDLTADDVIAEFGLEPRRAYFARANVRRDAALRSPSVTK